MTNEAEWITGRVTLSFNDTPIEMEMSVPANPVKARRMLPIFQQMTGSFVNLSVQAAEQAGRSVSCKKGCGACCRQGVPLAEIEAYQIAELVENMPEPRRSQIKQKFEEGCRRFYENGWFERLDNYAQYTNEERIQIIKDYFNEAVACPFLEDESCSIHADRPLACREYLVTSSPEFCAKPSKETIRMVEMPIKPSKSLRYFARSDNPMKINFIPMIRALEWAENNPEKMSEKTWQQWMADFFEVLTYSEIPDDER
jgi:Fe-S-cluster containining protein